MASRVYISWSPSITSPLHPLSLAAINTLKSWIRKKMGKVANATVIIIFISGEDMEVFSHNHFCSAAVSGFRRRWWVVQDGEAGHVHCLLTPFSVRLVKGQFALHVLIFSMMPTLPHLSVTLPIRLIIPIVEIIRFDLSFEICGLFIIITIIIIVPTIYVGFYT